MKQKIGEATCRDCGFKACDVGLDKSGHPYQVCWGKECDGAQYFSHGKKPRVAVILESLRPLPGVDVPALREKYGLAIEGQSSSGPVELAAVKPAKTKTIFG